MAYEVTDWKKPNCTLPLKVDDFSAREESSREINQTRGEGGGLNANYRTLEALAIASNTLGTKLGMEYGRHFIFKTAGFGIITLDFCDEDHRNKAAEIL